MTSCTEQTFGDEIKRLQREVEGLTKTRELQEAKIQQLARRNYSMEEVVAIARIIDALADFNGPEAYGLRIAIKALDKCGYVKITHGFQ